jgi:hypothetical protein
MLMERDLHPTRCSAARGYGQIWDGRRVFGMAADSREVAPGKGARWTATSHVDVEPPMGPRHDGKRTGDWSHSEERHAVAAAVLMMCRRKKESYRH